MKELFPIGTVVLLREGTKPVMIIGFYVSGEKDDKIYDYLGCLYPEGVLTTSENLVFNHADISQLIFRGLETNEEREFKQKLYFAFNNLNIKN